MINTPQKIIKKLKISGYDFINVVDINKKIMEKGYDTAEIISNEKVITEINILAIKNYYITNIYVSKSFLNQIKNIEKFIEKNSIYNKTLSISYLNTYLKDSGILKKINKSIDNTIQNDKNDFIPDDTKKINDNKVLSFLTYKIRNKINIANSFGVNRMIEYKNNYSEGLIETKNDLHFSFNTMMKKQSIDERIKFYNNQFDNISFLKGKVKLTGSAMASILRQLMYIFNGDLIYSNTTFITSYYFGKIIFPKYIDIIDDPNNNIFNNKMGIDFNGIITKKKYIIKNGVVFDLFGDINSNLRNGFAGPGNYYKKTSGFNYSITTYRNLILNVKKQAEEQIYDYEIRGFSLDSYLNYQTGIFSGVCYGIKKEGKCTNYISSKIDIDIIKFFNNIKSLSGNRVYEDVCCPDIILDYKEVNNA